MLNHPSYDEAERILRVGNFIWDTAILDWVKATGTAVAPNVNVTNFPAVQAVSGPLTVAELIALLPLPVDVFDLFLLDATFTARINTLGQKLMAASTPVVLASDQSAIPISGSIANLFLLEATFAARINTLGQKLMAASTPVVLPSDQSAIPISGSIANLFLLDATFTGRINTLGQKLMAASTPVVLASDQTFIPTAPLPATLSITVTGAANAIATATLPAAGAGLFHHITHICIKRVATAALAGGAILTVTTTNLNGRTFRTGNQMSITVATQEGTVLRDQEFTHPMKSAVANTATTFVGPAAGAAVSWHMVIDYFTGL